MEIKREFDAMALRLGWKPEELGEKLLLDFMETVHRRSYRRNAGDQTGEN